MVEDEKRLAAAVKKGLESEGFAVDVALNGIDGMWLATEQDYDLVVLDILLPGKNGFQICKELREKSIWSPILMLTAKQGEHDEAEALDSGADDFLSKPFSYVVLLARVRALLRRGSTPRPTDLCYGELKIDLATKKCTRGLSVIELTPKEFAVIEYLLRKAGQVVSKTEILEHVWDYSFEGDINVVEVHVSSLRKKLDLPFSYPIIRTIRGVGYMLVTSDG